MQNHDEGARKYQVEFSAAEEAVLHTEYAGIVMMHHLWKAIGVENMLDNAGIQYGSQPEAASEMSFMLNVQPWIRSDSQRRAAQRFGGEPSPQQLEMDTLLSQLLTQSYSQRQVNRFANTTRYNWQAFNRERIAVLQKQSAFALHKKGVIIVDDFPLPKPYAKEMTHLTSIWDNNLKHSVPGYAVVHLYYYHPHRPGYSLYVEPWLKTSATGETRSKRGARRRAQPGEERSKLDIALEALEAHLDLVSQVEAVIFDSWYTARWLGHELSTLGITWIGDAKIHQKFQVGHHYLSTEEIFRCYRTRTRRLKGFAKKVQAVVIPATIRPDPYTKVAQPVQLILVTGLTKKRDNDKGYHLLVTNHLSWTMRHIVRLFSARPVIEQEHRTGKQQAGWNDFHTRSLAALQCHLALCLLRTTFLKLVTCLPALRDYSLDEFIEHGLAGVAILKIDPKQKKLRVLLPPNSPLIALGDALFGSNHDLVFTCKGAIPF